MNKLNFKPWHGQAYQRFNIMVQLPDRKRRIGRLIAPNHELALIKSRELFPQREVFVELREDKDETNKEAAASKKKPSKRKGK